MKEAQYNKYDRDDDQSMDPTACAWEIWTYIPAEKAEQPQNYQNDDDSPQHEISPFNALLEATWLVDRVAV